MEENLSRALIISQNHMSIFFGSPISITIWMITAAALLGSVLPLAKRLSRARAGGA